MLLAFVILQIVQFSCTLVTLKKRGFGVRRENIVNGHWLIRSPYDSSVDFFNEKLFLRG